MAKPPMSSTYAGQSNLPVTANAQAADHFWTARQRANERRRVQKTRKVKKGLEDFPEVS